MFMSHILHLKQQKCENDYITIFRVQGPNMPREGFIHLKHVDGGNTEKSLQWLVAIYMPPITWILQVLLSYVAPKLLDNLGKNSIAHTADNPLIIPDWIMTNKNNFLGTLRLYLCPCQLRHPNEFLKLRRKAA